MKLLIFNIFFFIVISSFAQSIQGELKPCPGIEYTYSNNTSSCNNFYSWSIPANAGIIKTTNGNTVTIVWAKEPTSYSTITCIYYSGSDCSTRTLTLTVNIKSISPINSLLGPSIIEVGFRGNTTYNAGILDPDFKPDIYEWTTNTGWSGASTTSSITYNVTNDNGGFIQVRGYNKSCNVYSDPLQINITRSVPQFSISGPGYFCVPSQDYSINIKSTESVVWSVSDGLTINGPNNSSTVNISRGDNAGQLIADVTLPNGQIVRKSTFIYHDLALIAVDPENAVYVERLDGRITATIGIGAFPTNLDMTFFVYVNGVLVRTTKERTTGFYIDSLSPKTLTIKSTTPCGKDISFTTTITPTLTPIWE